MIAMGMSYHLALASKLTPPWATVVSVCVGAYALVRGYTAGKEADVEIAKAQSPADQLADAEEG
jgi:hydrogenase/urease accessory protein HupE